MLMGTDACEELAREGDGHAIGQLVAEKARHNRHGEHSEMMEHQHDAHLHAPVHVLALCLSSRQRFFSMHTHRADVAVEHLLDL